MLGPGRKGNDLNAWQWTDQKKPSSAIGVRATVGAVAVADASDAASRPYLFVRGYDSNLHLNWWSGTAWQWDDQGTPAGGSVIGSVGAVTVQDSASSGQRPYAFVIGDDSNLHVNSFDGAKWVWNNHDAPGGRRVREGVGVVTVRDTPSSAERPYAFVIGDDFHLWLNFWTGSVWTWTDLGTPPGHKVSRPIGVTTVRDTPSAGDRPYAFVITEDSTVWANSWSGTAWTWTDQGAPSGQRVRKGAGVVHVRDTPTAGERPYAFVIGYDSQLYANVWTGSQWTWEPHNTPSGRFVLGSVGAVTVADSPQRPTRPYVFVTGDDSQLYVRVWDATQWTWEAHNSPSTRVIERPGAVTTVRGSASAGQRPYAFVIADDSDVWSNNWS